MIHFCTLILDLSLIVQDLLVRLTLNFPMDPHGFSAIWIYSKSAWKAIILFLAFAAGFPSAASCLLPRFPRVTKYFKKRLRQKEQRIFWDDALAWTENIPSNPKPPVFFLRWFPGKFFFHWASYLMNYRASKIEIQKSDSTRFVHSSPRVLSRDQSW